MPNQNPYDEDNLGSDYARDDTREGLGGDYARDADKEPIAEDKDEELRNIGKASEKPFSLDRESGLGLLKAADAAGIRLGTAPDTFLGAGLQTARRIIERGDIGTPLTER